MCCLFSIPQAAGGGNDPAAAQPEAAMEAAPSLACPHGAVLCIDGTCSFHTAPLRPPPPGPLAPPARTSSMSPALRLPPVSAALADPLPNLAISRRRAPLMWRSGWEQTQHCHVKRQETSARDLVPCSLSPAVGMQSAACGVSAILLAWRGQFILRKSRGGATAPGARQVSGGVEARSRGEWGADG